MLAAGEFISFYLPQGRYAWLQVIKGEVGLNNTSLKPGDGAAVSDEWNLMISAVKDAEVVLFDLKR